MATVTISRQFGSGGSDVARKIAHELNWNLVDQNIVDLIAQKAGLPADEVAEHEERAAGLVERLAQSLAATAPDVFAGTSTTVGEPLTEDVIHKVTQTVIAEIVQSGNSVIVGRGAHAYLENRGQTLHVFVAADEAVRIKRVAERMNVSEKEAAKHVAEKDANRRRYVESYYDRTWADPAHYHVVLNTGLLTIEEAATVIVQMVKERGWE
jgi:cytidylate kinase